MTNYFNLTRKPKNFFLLSFLVSQSLKQNDSVFFIIANGELVFLKLEIYASHSPKIFLFLKIK